MEPRGRFGPQPVVVFPLLIATVGSLPLAASVTVLAWLPALPLLACVWALRARVVVTPRGLEVCNGVRRRALAWESVEGFDLPRRGPVLLLHDGRRTVLTALPRHELGRLVRVAEEVAGPVAARS